MPRLQVSEQEDGRIRVTDPRGKRPGAKAYRVFPMSDGQKWYCGITEFVVDKVRAGAAGGSVINWREHGTKLGWIDVTDDFRL